ncbi:MFS transporter [Rhodococcus sp. TAF43]|uniref:MFS transporter n=1 Tax=unclassified Rhodococcus (in: high G+C Gram-positive bacteria) TaxID=192944 RepID=UPI0020C67C79|nr:MFS transporter [Rhodococcus sp. W8901]
MSARPATAPLSQPPSPTRRSSALITAVLCMCGTIVSLQQTLVVPLLPDLRDILGVSADDAFWLVTITLLTAAVATPIVSRLADMVGKRRMMLVAMGMMVCGSLVAALGGTFVAVLIGRGLQGFASSLIAVGIGIMRDELPREKVPAATALMSATLGLGSALGLPLAGVIYANLGWHAIFWISAAAGALLFVAVVLVVPESKVRTPGRFDFPGALILSVALASLLLGISKGGSWGWGSSRTIGCFVLAVVVLAIWMPYQLRVKDPMVNLRTSARRPVLLTNLASMIVGFAMFANMLSTTQQLQMPEGTGYGFGLSVFTAGLCMVPAGLAMVVFSPLSAKITTRFGARITLITGALILAVAYVVRVLFNGSIELIILGSMMVNIGTAITYSAMPILIMQAVPISETAASNGLNSLLRSIGTSTSSAVVTALLTAMTLDVAGVQLPTLAAFQTVFAVACGMAILAAVVAWFIPRTARKVPVSTVVEASAEARVETAS